MARFFCFDSVGHGFSDGMKFGVCVALMKRTKVSYCGGLTRAPGSSGHVHGTRRKLSFSFGAFAVVISARRCRKMVLMRPLLKAGLIRILTRYTQLVARRARGKEWTQ
jgi:hypothetical protein